MLHGAAAVVYIGAVVTFMLLAGPFFGTGVEILGMMLMLMLFVFSAAFMSVVFFARPVTMYVDGQKKEALSLLAWTLASFCTLGVLIGLVVVIIKMVA